MRLAPCDIVRGDDPAQERGEAGGLDDGSISARAAPEQIASGTRRAA